jgi:hypothetical protein
METPERRLDFALDTTLKEPIAYAQLLAGAKHARAIHPRADQIIAGEEWIRAEMPAESLLALGDDALFDRPLDPRREPLRQTLLGDRRLITKSHHAAADLTSALLFLRAQLDRSITAKPLQLRTHPHPVRKSRFAQAGPSARLWTRRRRPSGERRVRAFDVDARLRAAIGEGFTYNDLLGTAALTMLRRFQEAHRADSARLSLWFPVNVRVDPWEGFGNGSSRIRIYGRHLVGPLLDRARGFREQVRWSKEHGEWAVPEKHPLLQLPASMRRPVLRAYLRRPWVDMGTMLFSHLERLAPAGELPIERIEIQCNLDRTHAAGIAGVTLGDRTQMSLTYDPALLETEDVDLLISFYQETIEEARRELERCAA